MQRPHALLLDFDGLLADYDHRIHLRQLADAAGCAPEQVDAALRTEGLEFAHARGELDGEQLLQALNQRLDSELIAAHWRAARLAATRLRSDCMAVLERVHSDVQVAVLTNNGLLTQPAIEQLLGSRRVLCSAALGVRKPDPAAYLAACAALGCAPERSLFVDHLFRNVQGAREARLHADTAFHAQSLRRLLKRNHCLG
ncbi:HAD-IA family hydrolase [Stenotrophomonas sp.]|uniref:HAD-IA family hydrolase n=1 Tax=Stenotrophomonas sp. TaxID=69392 RepID=UPI0028A665F1|nr:HAD-IA family hydrolase [Stenotrophomonas sp.]